LDVRYKGFAPAADSSPSSTVSGAGEGEGDGVGTAQDASKPTAEELLLINAREVNNDSLGMISGKEVLEQLEQEMIKHQISMGTIRREKKRLLRECVIS
jgi:hypothetical protein